MRAVSRDKQKRRLAASIAIAVVVAAVVAAVFGLTSFIDKKLNQSAEQQVVTFTEQAAANVADRMLMSQNAIAAFSVQTTDLALIAPSLQTFEEYNMFANAAFADMDGEGIRSDGTPFSVSEMEQEETALSEGRRSYSSTFENEDGERVRLAQTPLYIDDRQIGALYVQVPLKLFSMPRHLDMFDGRGYFMLFENETGEVLVPPTDGTKTPVSIGTSLYDFLESASRYDGLVSDTDAATDTALQLMQARAEKGLNNLRDVVKNGQTGLMTALVDGKASYVCVAPVDSGFWYVCSIVPVENVRAEAAVVTTAFEAVFAVVFACLVMVALLLFGGYRRRLREQNVAMQEQLYEAMSDSIDMAVNLYSPSDGKVTPIVAKAAMIIGYRMDVFLRNERLAADIGLSPEGSALFDRIRSNKVKNFEQGEFSFRNKQTGKDSWASYSVKRLTFDGKSQLLVVLRDVTADKEIQLGMKDAMDVAEAANAAKSEFLSRMSHEIRTPMNVIIGMLQIAQSNVHDSEKVSVSLAKLGAASDHLLGLINDVLDISKIENGKMTLASEPFRLRDLLQQVIAVVRIQCDQRDQEFIVTIPSCADAVFVGDTIRLKQLLLNLLTNAVKYTPHGGRIRLEVLVASGAAMGYRQVKFIVSDNGMGMSEEFQEHIFEPFSMEGRSREQGTGLGMPIVKNIVTMMSGDISVQSMLGLGTTFTVVLNMRMALEAERIEFEEEEAEQPVAGVLEAPGAVVAQPLAAGEHVASDPLGYQARPAHAYAPVLRSSSRALDRSEFEGLRVLMAEDNDLNAEIAVALLEMEGVRVQRAANGREAVDMFAASEPGSFDFVLMDVKMPVLDGLEAAAEIRRLDRPDAQTTHIIALTANTFQEDREDAAAAGMDGFVPKPFDARQLYDALRSFLPPEK